jgi:hypothetical protein
MRVVGYSGFILISAILTGLYYWRPSKKADLLDDERVEEASNYGYYGGDMSDNGSEMERASPVSVDNSATGRVGSIQRERSIGQAIPAVNNRGDGMDVACRRRLMRHVDQNERKADPIGEDGFAAVDQNDNREEVGGTETQTGGYRSAFNFGGESYIAGKDSDGEISYIGGEDRVDFHKVNSLEIGCFKKFLLRGSFRGGEEFGVGSIYKNGPWVSQDKKCKNGFFNKFLWFGIIMPYGLVVAGLVMCFLEKKKLGDLLVATGAFLLILQPAFSLCGGTVKDNFTPGFMGKVKLIFGYAAFPEQSVFVGIHIVRFLVHTCFFAFSILCLVGMFDEEEEEESKEQAVEAVGDAKGDVEAPPAHKSAAENKGDKDADKDAVVQVADSSSDAVSQDA